MEAGAEPEVELPRLTTGEQVVQDYTTYHLSLRPHPMQLLRLRMVDLGVVQSSQLAELPVDRPVRVAGLVLVRQRPGTASGVIFATLEDEQGVINLIIWPKASSSVKTA